MTDVLGTGKAQAHSEDIVAPDRDHDLKKYYRDVLDWGDNEQVLEEILKLRRDHEGACKLAWELYLAGTGQTNENFRGTKGAPQDEVAWARNDLMDALEQANILICGGTASDPTMADVWTTAENRFRGMFHHILGVGVPLGGRLAPRPPEDVSPDLVKALIGLSDTYGLRSTVEAAQRMYYQNAHTAPGSCGPECATAHTNELPCRMTSHSSNTVGSNGN
jgi:hypothetical protein